MVRYYIKALLSVILIFSYGSVIAAPEKYMLDPHHSFVIWKIDHLGFSKFSGKWPAKGTLILDQKNPSKSKVDVTIPINDIVTGVPKLDEHLLAADFFDAKKYPDATFVSNKIVLTGKKTAKVTGTLTLHGVSKPVVLHVTFNKHAKSPIDNKMRVGFNATANIKRADFGIDSYLPAVGNQVELDIQAEASHETQAD